jgi:hypothetical protein
MEEEVWKPVKEFEEYYLISSLGNVQTIKTGKLRKIQINEDGYLCLLFCVNHKRNIKYIHILKAEAWIPNPLNLPEVNHIDGNKQNCDISNLEWCTRKHNVIHAYKTGLMNPVHGEKSGQSKLTNIQVIEIRNLKGKIRGNKVAIMYGVDKSTIYDIFHNRIWKHLL